MTGLNDVVQKYAEGFVLGAKAPAAKAEETTGTGLPSPLQGALKKDLDEVRDRNEKFFWIYVGMVAAVFVVFIGVVLFFKDLRYFLEAATALFGVTAAGLMKLMLAAWREKQQTEIVLVLVRYMDDDVIRTFFIALSSELLTKKPRGRSRRAK